MTDIAIGTEFGKLAVFMGDGDGSLNPYGRLWTLPTVNGQESWETNLRVYGVAAADVNQDGLAEVFVADMGVNPKSITIWLNRSR